MIVTCPECGARYRLADDAIPPEGRAMRCSACGHRWYQAAPDAPAPQPELPAALQQEFGIETSTPPVALVTAPAPEPAPTPEQLAWTPAPDIDEPAPDDAPRSPTLLKNALAVILGLAFTAGAAAMCVPGLDLGKLPLPRIILPPVDLSQVPWLDRLVNRPAPVVSPLTIGFSVDRQALADGRPLFVIAGTVTNPTTVRQELGAITGHLVDPSNAVTFSWRIAPPVASLAPHQRIEFESSAIGQPYGGERVTLRFAT